jgi:hypothetical protein
LDAVTAGRSSGYYDINSNGIVDENDVTALLSSLGSLPGDANLDGVVNAVDLNQVGLNWRAARCATWSDGDFSGDGAITAVDLNILALRWRQSVGRQAASAPTHQRQPRAPLGATAIVVATEASNATALQARSVAPHAVSETSTVSVRATSQRRLTHTIKRQENGRLAARVGIPARGTSSRPSSTTAGRGSASTSTPSADAEAEQFAVLDKVFARLEFTASRVG